jgi:hypothetical protein
VRRAVLVAVLAVSSLPMVAVHADESYLCWTERREDPARALPRSGVVCRIAGGERLVFEGRPAVPVVLHAAVGYDALGECWYWRSVFTGWVVVRRDGGRAQLRFDSPSDPAGPSIFDAWVRGCDGEPVSDRPPLELVWEVIRSFDFVEPEATIEPSVGMSGLDTFLTVVPPRPEQRRVVSPGTGRRIIVDLRVGGVEVAWGDGAVTAVGAGSFDRLVGHPDGMLRHRYETTRVYPVTVTYRWAVRWRVETGPWQEVLVDPSRAIGSYRVDRAVGRRIA